MTRLHALLQTNRIHLPPSTEARMLGEELLQYEVTVAEDANDRYGAFKVGSQDAHERSGAWTGHDGPSSWVAEVERVRTSGDRATPASALHDRHRIVVDPS